MIVLVFFFVIKLGKDIYFGDCSNELVLGKIKYDIVFWRDYLI